MRMQATGGTVGEVRRLDRFLDPSFKKLVSFSEALGTCDSLLYVWAFVIPHFTYTCCQQKDFHSGVADFGNLRERSKEHILRLLVDSRPVRSHVAQTKSNRDGRPPSPFIGGKLPYPRPLIQAAGANPAPESPSSNPNPEPELPSLNPNPEPEPQSSNSNSKPEPPS